MPAPKAKNGELADMLAINPSNINLLMDLHPDYPDASDRFNALLPFGDYNLHALSWASVCPRVSAAQMEIVLNKETKLVPDYYFNLSDFLHKLGRDKEAAEAARHGAASAIDQVGVSNHLDWLIKYDTDHGLQAEAQALSGQAGSTDSETGLNTEFQMAVKQKDFTTAERDAQALKDNYGDERPLHLLYHQNPTVFPGKYDELLKKAFPDGVIKVTLASFSGPPATGAQVQGSDPGKENPFKNDDVIVALSGVRVESNIQYCLIRDELDGAQMNFIVWRKDHFMAISVKNASHMFGFTLVPFTQIIPKPASTVD